MLTSRWVRHGDSFLQPVQTGDCSTIYGRMWRSIVDLRSWGRRGRRKVLLCRSRCMRGSCGPARSVSCSRGVGGVEHRTGAGWRVTVRSSGHWSAVRVSGLEGSRTRNGQWTHRGARAAAGAGCRCTNNIAYHTINIVARFTVLRRPAHADRTLGTHDGSGRGQGPCAGGDRRIKPVDVRS